MTRRILYTISLAVLLAACSSDDPDPGTNPDGTAGNGGAAANGAEGGGGPVTFQQVFDGIRVGVNCAGPLCHTSIAGGNLAMPSADAAYAELIDVPASGAECGTSELVRVVPGDPQASLFYLKLFEPPCGDPMPVAGPLEPDQIELVRQWIADGALE